MRLVAKGIREMRWGPSFWLFAARYYVMPWYGLRASLSMKRDEATPFPLYFRLLYAFTNYVLLAFLVLWSFLLSRNVIDGYWWIILLLSSLVAMKVAVILVRLQAVFKLSGQRDQVGG